ncbi:hypothetical protein D3C85_1591530 [compost metagenome]
MQTSHQSMGGLGPAVAFQIAARLGRGPLGQIGAGAEAPAAAGQHQHAHSAIGAELIKQRMQGLERGNVQRIALIGAIQGDPGDAAFHPGQ